MGALLLVALCQPSTAFVPAFTPRVLPSVGRVELCHGAVSFPRFRSRTCGLSRGLRMAQTEIEYKLEKKEELEGGGNKYDVTVNVDPKMVKDAYGAHASHLLSHPHAQLVTSVEPVCRGHHEGFQKGGPVSWLPQGHYSAFYAAKVQGICNPSLPGEVADPGSLGEEMWEGDLNIGVCLRTSAVVQCADSSFTRPTISFHSHFF